MTNTRSLLIRLCAGIFGITIIAGLLATVPVTKAAAAELSEAGAKAFAEIAACAASADPLGVHLLAEIVVDVSGSLRKTDPKDRRIDAVVTALDSLAQLHAASDGKLDVQTKLTTFGNGYTQLVGWGSVEGDHANALKNAATSSLQEKGEWTNYEEALRGAQNSLNSRADQLDGTSCKVLLWFTDGKLEIPDSTGKKSNELTEAARDRICEEKGIADSVRDNDIAVIGLALFTSGGEEEVSESDRQQFKAIVEGQAAGSTCGTAPIARGAAQGAYLHANDASALGRLFAQAAAMIEGATPSLSGCPGPNCSEGQLTFPVDEGIGGFRLVIQHSAGATSPQLHAPGMLPITLDPGATSLPGSKLRVTDLNGLMTIDVDFESGTSGVGTWVLDLDPSKQALVDLYYKWGVTLKIDAPENLLVGDVGVINVTPMNRDMTSIDLSVFNNPDLDVKADGATVMSKKRTATGWEVSIEIDRSDIAHLIRVDATAIVNTKQNAITLGPITAHKELVTRFPASFPNVLTDHLVLPTIEGSNASAGTLEISGSEEGNTRVCIEEIAMKGPKAAGSITLTPSAGFCVEIPQGKTVPIKIQADTTHPADGVADGVVKLTLHEVEEMGNEERTLSIPVSVSMVRPVNQAVLWYMVALLIALAVGGAWISAEVMRRVSERFKLTTDARFASVDVLASAKGIRRVDGKTPLLDAAHDFEAVENSQQGRVANFSLAGLTFGRSFNALNPLSEGRPWVESPSEVVTVPGGDRLMLNDAGSRAPVRLPGTVDFVFAANPSSLSDGEVQGRLVVIIDSPAGVSSVLQSRLNQISESPWDRILEAIALAVATRTGTSGEISPEGSINSSTPRRDPDYASASTEFLGAADDTETDAPPPPSWANDVSAPSQLPEAQTSPSAPKRRGKKSKLSGKTVKSGEKKQPPNDLDGPPPSSINFWD